MSIRARIQISGSITNVFKPKRTDAGDGTTAVTWLPKLSGERILLQEESSGVEQQDHGQERKARLTGFALPQSDVEEDDGIVVQSGLHAGKRMIVRSAPVHRGAGGSTGHIELDLETTLEAVG